MIRRVHRGFSKRWVLGAIGVLGLAAIVSSAGARRTLG